MALDEDERGYSVDCFGGRYSSGEVRTDASLGKVCRGWLSTVLYCIVQYSTMWASVWIRVMPSALARCMKDRLCGSLSLAIGGWNQEV